MTEPGGCARRRSRAKRLGIKNGDRELILQKVTLSHISDLLGCDLAQSSQTEVGRTAGQVL